MAIPQLWTTEYLASLASEAEIEISTQIPCIYVRFPVSLIAGQSNYNFSTLATPQRLTGIIRVTFRGKPVWPIHSTLLRNGIPQIRPLEGDSEGDPQWYVRTGYGIDGIKLFPTPSANLAYDSSNINTRTGIQNNFIVSGWRIADGSTYMIPDYIRETLIRYYVMSYAFRKEGKGQNLDAAKYFDKKYAMLLQRFRTITSQLFSIRNHFVKDSIPAGERGGKPPHPSLPSNFGEIVY